MPPMADITDNRQGDLALLIDKKGPVELRTLGHGEFHPVTGPQDDLLRRLPTKEQRRHRRD